MVVSGSSDFKHGSASDNGNVKITIIMVYNGISLWMVIIMVVVIIVEETRISNDW